MFGQNLFFGFILIFRFNGLGTVLGFEAAHLLAADENHNDDDSEEDKVLCYLAKAFNNIFGEPHEEVVLLKNGIQVPPKDILEIKPLECWR